MTEKKANRKQDILQKLASMLEDDLSERITTARLAKAVGVSEAALYRHFPSKARMYETLLDFCEESIFTRVNHIAASPQSALEKSFLIASFVLNFSQKNPGISRLLTAEVFLGETARLKQRVSQIFDKLELSIKQLIRNESIAEKNSTLESATTASLIAAIIEGRIQRFVRSGFSLSAIENWETQWLILMQGLSAE